ncbi:MAG: DUF2797 domain-containing protein [Candidatus Kariarchaeaceae archaeon]|jgi:hypothetical protein
MAYIFVKLVWKQDPIFPMFRIIPTKSKEYSELPLIIGDEFNIKIRGRKLCIGSEVAGQGWITCVANQIRLNKPYKRAGIQQERALSSEFIQCLDCRQASYFSCRQICIGKECNASSQEAFDACQGPRTSVYLTHLGGQLKVGVSLDIQRRWLEQGSDYGVELIKLPGLEARRLEQEISKHLDLSLQVRNTAKIRNYKAIREDYITGEFEEKIKQVDKIVEVDYAEIDKIEISKKVIVDLTSFYGNQSFERPIQLFDVQPNFEFGGVIESIKGSIIVVRNGIYLYGLDSKALTGYTIEILDRVASMAGQRSLDEWF